MTVMDDIPNSNSLSWDIGKAIVTDCALAMLGENSGFTIPVKRMLSLVTAFLIYMLRTEECSFLFARHVGCRRPGCQNYPSKDIESQCFQKLCKEYRPEYTVPLIHMDVR